MATWAHTVAREEYTREGFRAVAVITKQDRARWEAQVAAARAARPGGD